jgi:hypothetical protein
VEFFDHAGRVGTADVVAFDQDLAATAGTHQFVAEPVETRLSCAQHDDRHDAQ